MNLQETHRFLSAINQNDPRIEPSPYAASIWHEQLADFSPAEADRAYRDFASRSDDKPTARQIRLMGKNLRDRDKALASARQLPSRDVRQKSLAQFKADNPGRFLECYQAGYRSREGRDNPKPPAFCFDDSSASVVAGVGKGV